MLLKTIILYDNIIYRDGVVRNRKYNNDKCTYYRLASNNELIFNRFTAIINALNAAVARTRRRASG